MHGQRPDGRGLGDLGPRCGADEGGHRADRRGLPVHLSSHSRSYFCWQLTRIDGVASGLTYREEMRGLLLRLLDGGGLFRGRGVGGHEEQEGTLAGDVQHERVERLAGRRRRRHSGGVHGGSQVGAVGAGWPSTGSTGRARSLGPGSRGRRGRCRRGLGLVGLVCTAYLDGCSCGGRGHRGHRSCGVALVGRLLLLLGCHGGLCGLLELGDGLGTAAGGRVLESSSRCDFNFSARPTSDTTHCTHLPAERFCPMLVSSGPTMAPTMGPSAVPRVLRKDCVVGDSCLVGSSPSTPLSTPSSVAGTSSTSTRKLVAGALAPRALLRATATSCPARACGEGSGVARLQPNKATATTDQYLGFGARMG